MSTGANDSVPLYLKVAAELRRDIAEGQVGPGHRLPPARDLAAVAGVNQNTMFKALRLLRDEGFLEFQRGRGISVVGTPERGALMLRVRELLDYARGQGYQRAEIIELIEALP
jgi:GntR family transcriptional regulator